MSDHMQQEPIKRGPGRPPVNRPDPRSDVRQDSREDTRESPRLQRRHKMSDDKFHIPLNLVPEGLEWEFKRYTFGGQVEGYYQAELRENHWEPVLIENHMHIAGAIAPFGQTSGQIIKGDLILMQRPAYLCDDARAEQQAATDRMMNSNRTKLKEAPKGTFDRLADHPKIGPAIRKSSERLNMKEYE